MSDGENPKPVNVDPRWCVLEFNQKIQGPTKLVRDSIQEALRMYLQPIKSDDPQLDFYTMYKRETVEYDTEYMQKHNEDLNTTLIFAGLFSAVSSAFVIDVQSKLEPDSGERSEAYLRAILLSLNRSISPDENPATPPAWSGPPQEIITTSNLLYASLLMSLLAAFVAMLGKQWLNRYLRHAGGSMIERCGDRQRKFDGLKKWPFRLFIESLPIMLQIALVLLTCGLSRYMWSVNTSVARVVISFTVFGFLFYIVIVVAGTSSYECPFQTPVSMGLRHLRDSGTAQKWLSGLSPTNVISFIYTARRNTPGLLASLSLPNTASLIYATWMDARQRIVSASRRAHDIMRQPSSWEFSVSGILSGVRRTARNIGHQVIILLLQIDRAFGNTKQRLAQEIRMLRRAALLPISTRDAHHQSFVPDNGPGLRVRVRNLEGIRRQNADNARCVCWVLRNITDPEAIDSAIHLAGTIRWFDGDSDHNPPFDLIVSTFEACFDSTKRLYPRMGDRAYFSARAILQINTRARAQSNEHASTYPIPTIFLGSYRRVDFDLSNVIWILQRNLGAFPDLPFPDVDAATPTRSLWLSNLFVDLTHAGLNPILEPCVFYHGIAIANHRSTIANILLMWHMLLGGRVEEETTWAVDKSDSLETILSHLSVRVMDAIVGGNHVRPLQTLLGFLAAWEERPECLTPMAYQWCSAFSEMIRGPGSDWTYSPEAYFHHNLSQMGDTLPRPESRFNEVGPGCDLFHYARGPQRDLNPYGYVELLFKTLEIGFRLVRPGHLRPGLRLNHTPHQDRVFEVAFSGGGDEVIADAVCAWITATDSGCSPADLFAHHFFNCVERTTSFSPKLRQMSIHAICRTWSSGLIMSAPETIRLLNHLEAGVGDVRGRREQLRWVYLLIEVIRSPTGFESLSSHNWHLLGGLMRIVKPSLRLSFPVLRDIEVARSLEEAEDWEKLEVWLAAIWGSLMISSVLIPELMEGIEPMTLKVSLRQRSALQRFEDQCKRHAIGFTKHKVKLQEICSRTRAQQLPSEASPPPQSAHAQPLILLEDDTF